MVEASLQAQVEDLSPITEFGLISLAFRYFLLTTECRKIIDSLLHHTIA